MELTGNIPDMFSTIVGVAKIEKERQIVTEIFYNRLFRFLSVNDSAAKVGAMEPMALEDRIYYPQCLCLEIYRVQHGSIGLVSPRFLVNQLKA